MFDEAQIRSQLEKFKEYLDGDDHVFTIIDLRLPVEQALPREVIGENVKGLILNGHYHVEYLGPNSSSTANRNAEAIAEAKKAYPNVKYPKTVAQQLDELKAENEQLKQKVKKPLEKEKQNV